MNLMVEQYYYLSPVYNMILQLNSKHINERKQLLRYDFILTVIYLFFFIKVPVTTRVR